ncbi:MAG: L-fuculokinase [Breznakibacter sp.]
MTSKDIAIVFDCGATNVRVIAMDTSGTIVASQALANQTDEDPYYQGGRIWDVEKMWGKLTQAARQVTASLDPGRIAGVTITTFGVDGTFVDQDGTMLYPVISWQCNRTQPIMETIGKYIPVEMLYRTSGVYPYAYNTINKLVWFKENRPDIIDRAHQFVFIPSLFIHKLTGHLQNDATMAGTAMVLDLQHRKPSHDILARIGLNADILGPLAEPGSQAGSIQKQAATETGIPEGTPVFFGGHDTQFAIFGSGASLNQPVLSSGTWEILMARANQFRATEEEFACHITTEADAIPGIFNIGQNWLASGVLEWFSSHFYRELSGDALYNTMIGEAEAIAPGSHGLTIDPAFYRDAASPDAGTISGLTLNTSRAQIYRALLESLAYRLREGLEALECAGQFKAERIICVGGGSKNRLWNQLRADVCNLPIQIINQKETTVLGAALFIFAGTGLFQSPAEARENIDYQPQVIEPSADRQKYNELYKNHQSLKRIKKLS